MITFPEGSSGSTKAYFLLILKPLSGETNSKFFIIYDDKSPLEVSINESTKKAVTNLLTTSCMDKPNDITYKLKDLRSIVEGKKEKE